MKLNYYCLFLFLSFVISGCNNNDDFSSMCFEKEYYEKPLLDDVQEIVFNGGSGNFSVEVSNKDILEVFVNGDKLEIRTKKKGLVSIVVRDNLESTSVSIKIKVIDRYLCLRLASPVPDNSYYEKEDHLFLVNDENRVFYLYDGSFNLKYKGNYQLFRENDKFCLSLSYPKDLFLYDISSSSHVYLWGYVPYYLGISWVNEKLMSHFREASLEGMTAVDFNTDKIYYFVVDNSEMPPGVLN